MTDNYRVYMVPLPGDIKGAVRLDDDGFASIYINDSLSPQAKKSVFEHEMQHIKRNDHYNDKTIKRIEA